MENMKYIEIEIDYGGFSKKNIFLDLDEISLVQGFKDSEDSFWFQVVLKGGYVAVDMCRDFALYEKILFAKKALHEYEITHDNH